MVFIKTVLRMFKKNILRFIFLTGIIFLGISFVSGLSISGGVVKSSVSDYYQESKVTDLIIKTTEITGIRNSDVNTIKDLEFVEDVYPFTSLDVEVDEYDYRVYLLDYENLAFNTVTLLEGNYPENYNQVLIEKNGSDEFSYQIGDIISIPVNLSDLSFTLDLEVCGILSNPLYISKQLEYSNNLKDGVEIDDLTEANPEDFREISTIIYLDYSVLGLLSQIIPYTDMYVKFNNIPADIDYFSQEYLDIVNDNLEVIQEELSASNYVYLTLNENSSYRSLNEYTEKVDIITLIFPVFFILITSLVTLVTITRLIEEERGIIGTYMTLGISRSKIIFKYLSFGLIAAVIGVSVGIVLGIFILPYMIYNAFNVAYFLPATLTLRFNFTIGGISCFLIFGVVMAICLGLTLRHTREQPADLLRPKTPKAGKKILLERIPFIWKHLKFKFKSSLRNLFRQKLHFIMTIVSVAGSTVLVLAGFGLNDVSNALKSDPLYGDMIGSIQSIAVIVILFAVALCLLVLFNLTNMNISERERELATLKVLGYKNVECSMYTFREVLISSIFGLILGIPLGFLLLYYLLDYIDFGSVFDVTWYSYVCCALLVIVAVLLVNLLLYSKIKKIDMNNSLKSYE